MCLKVFKASAGSGKTYQLALEYIVLALQTSSPNNFSKILAVTFTNMATAEMKDRILIQLYNLANDGLDKDFMKKVCEGLRKFKENRDINEKEVQRRAANTLRAIIHDYDHFRVETIDSFFQSLLSNLAHELKLSRTFRVDLDIDDAISNAVDELLLTIDGRIHLSDLILSYMQDHVDQSEGWNIARDLKSFAKKNIFSDDYMRKEYLINKFLSDEKHFGKWQKELKDKFEAYHQKLLPPLQKLNELLNSEQASLLKAYSGMRDYVSDLMADNFAAVPSAKTINACMEDSGELLKKTQKDDKNLIALAEQIASLLRDIKQVLSKDDAANFMNTYKLVQKNMVPLRLLSAIGSEVTRINNESNTLLLPKTLELFSNMVQTEDASFVFERAGTTFQHILIDEFQDTSYLQWDNFKRLLVERLSQGDECLLVGDVKQSIYRWRGGDWKILDNLSKLAHTLNLDTNFRSKQVVVECNNHFFDRAVCKLDSLNETDGLDSTKLVSKIYADVEQKPNDQSGEGYVRVNLLDKDAEDDALLEDLYKQIALLHDEYAIPYNKMSVLVRSNKEILKIIEYFTVNHSEIPFTSDEAFKLSSSAAVMLLVYLLKHVVDKTDTLALEMANHYHRFFSTTYSVEMPTLDEDFFEKLRSETDRVSIYELCQSLILKLKFSQCEERGAGQSAYLFSFFDYLLDYLDNKSSDLNGFLQYWDDTLFNKSIAVSVTDSIYIMTIHKSKGLQRHTIFVPFCNWTLDKDYQDDVLWCSTEDMEKPLSELSLVPINTYQSKRVKSSFFNPAYQKEHLMQRVDNFNALYVALTRAETNLLIWSKPRKMAKTVNLLVQCLLEEDNYFQKSVPADNEQMQILTRGKLLNFQSKKKDDEEEVPVKTNPLVMDNARNIDVKMDIHDKKVSFMESNQAKDFLRDLVNDVELTDETTQFNTKEQDDGMSYVERGNLYHYLLSQVKLKTDLHQVVQKSINEGLFPNQVEAQRFEKLMERRLANPAVTAWFDGSCQIHAECSLLMRNESGEVVQQTPDRVMKCGDKFIVVDYKFASHREDYVKQVRGYMEALAKMSHTKVEGYLWYVYKGEVCQVTL